MACLKAGNLTAAREKFSRCLKPPFDLSQLSHGSRLVQEVVEYLESTARPLLSVVRAQQAQAGLRGTARPQSSNGLGRRSASVPMTVQPWPRAVQFGFPSFQCMWFLSQESRLVMSYSLRPMDLLHARLPCPSPSM